MVSRRGHSEGEASQANLRGTTRHWSVFNGRVGTRSRVLWRTLGAGVRASRVAGGREADGRL